jgi:hypothetical protein
MFIVFLLKISARLKYWKDNFIFEKLFKITCLSFALSENIII